jgi:lipopolysaccharide biosynthesis glycosyltransferase
MMLSTKKKKRSKIASTSSILLIPIVILIVCCLKMQFQLSEFEDARVGSGGNTGELSISTYTSDHHGENDEGDAKKKPRFAYVFLIAGCKPEDPTYKGYVYNIAISNEILKEHNSVADVVVLLRMHSDTKHTSILPEDEAILTKTGIIVKYIPSPVTDNFHTAMMDKFRILELTEYERVIYLDADVMPLNSMDYLFEHSVGPDAKTEENIVMAYHSEPSNGGLFMLKPDKQDFLEITKIIERREKEGYHFNDTIGWGHVMTAPDQWESLHKSGTSWTFYGAFTDQGLLYYWTKYFKKKVSMINRDIIKTWKEGENGQVEMVREEKTIDVFGNQTHEGAYVKPRHRDFNLSNFLVPYKDFHHFVQKRKPWLDKKIATSPNRHVKTPRNEYQLWFNTLRKIEAEYHLGINTKNVYHGRPTLGTTPANSMIMDVKNNNEKNDSKAKE